MKQRLKKIGRLIKVQQQLHRNAELQLAQLQRQESELKSAQLELLQTMGDDAELHGLFVDVMARRLKALSLEEIRTQGAIAEQKMETVEKALQVRRSEKVHSRLREDVRREQEKADLASILEAVVQKGGTSLP